MWVWLQLHHGAPILFPMVGRTHPLKIFVILVSWAYMVSTGVTGRLVGLPLIGTEHPAIGLVTLSPPKRVFKSAVREVE
jgi:hypothetical protein